MVRICPYRPLSLRPSAVVFVPDALPAPIVDGSLELTGCGCPGPGCVPAPTERTDVNRRLAVRDGKKTLTFEFGRGGGDGRRDLNSCQKHGPLNCVCKWTCP